MTPDRVLFLGHDATRTGAPLLLLYLLRWIKANTTLPFEILLHRGGELEKDFRAVGPMTVLGGWQPRVTSRARRSLLLSRFGAGNGLVYSNTVTNGVILQSLATRRRPIISHIHELETRIRANGPANMDAVKLHTTHYIACSQAVRSNLIENHAIAPEKVEVIYEYIPTLATPDRDRVLARSKILSELGIPHNALIVGASGTTDWRKAPDLFVQLARCVTKRVSDLPVHFVWVGGCQPGSQRFVELSHDILATQLEGRVHFLGTKPDPADYFRTFDVFAMVSREDPFPIVCLEAASFGIPTVCFDRAGGIKEFVRDDCGFVVGYLDLEEMAERLERLLRSESLRTQLGACAAKRIRLNHDIAVIAPKIVDVIARYR